MKIFAAIRAAKDTVTRSATDVHKPFVMHLVPDVHHVAHPKYHGILGGDLGCEGSCTFGNIQDKVHSK